MARKKSASEIPIGGMITEAGCSVNFRTGNWRAMRPIVDHSKCVHCMLCVNYCPDAAILVTKDGKRGKFDLDYCKGCGICANQCPVKCIEMHQESEFAEDNKKK